LRNVSEGAEMNRNRNEGRKQKVEDRTKYSGDGGMVGVCMVPEKKTMKCVKKLL
jgi:hypothetical protein